MRIRRFSEARGIFEEEFSFEPQIHCFGGGGDSDGGGEADGPPGSGTGPNDTAATTGGNVGGGSGSTSSPDPSTNPGNIGVGSGASIGATSNNPGGVGQGNPNDNDGDGVPNSIDATPGVSAQQAMDDAVSNAISDAISDFGGGSTGGPSDNGAAADVMGMADLAEQAEQATSGVTDTSAAAEAISAMDAGFGPDGGIPSTPAQGIVSMARNPVDVASRAQMISRDEQAIADVQARNAVRGAADITSGQISGTMARDTTIDPSQMSLNPFGDSVFGSEEADAADIADMAARGNMTMAELAAVTPGTPAAAMVNEARSSALGGPTPGSMPGSTAVTGTPVADMTVTYGADDLAEAQANLEAAKDAAYSDKQFGFDTGLPGSIDVFGVDVPTSVGLVEGIADALFDPTSSAANAMAERGIKSVDGMSAEGTANYNPNGLEVVTAGGPLSEGGRTAAYDPINNVVYDSSPFSGLNPFGEGVPENIQNLYDTRNAIDDAQREREGDGGDGVASILPPPVPPEAVPTTPEEYQGRNIVGEATGYRPRGPINYAYTGLPSLAPVALRPSFRARGQYSPLFPVG